MRRNGIGVAAMALAAMATVETKDEPAPPKPKARKPAATSTAGTPEPLRGTVQVSRQLKRQIERLQAKRATPSPAEAARRRISKN